MTESSVVDKELTIKLWLEMAVGERHFRELQSKYRNLASTWLLASLAAIGYIVFISINKGGVEYVPFLIGFFCWLGVSLLWMLDVRGYHRLLNSFWVQGYKLELTYSFLPQVRKYMRKGVPYGDATKLVRIFYLACSFTPIVFGTLAIIVSNPRGFIIALSFKMVPILLVIMGLLFSFCVSFFLWRYSPDSQQDNAIKELDQAFEREPIKSKSVLDEKN